MRAVFRTLSIIAVLPIAACFHTTVYTGIPGAGETVSRRWVPSYLAGAVAPTAVEPAATCKAGVYRVETRHTLGNILVSAVTLGIYTPMRIDVTCARVPRVSLGPRPARVAR